MAQHISIMSNNIFPKLKESIIKRFAKSNIGLSSLNYVEIKSIEYKIFPLSRVFIYKRKINNLEEVFEIHFCIETKKVIDVFWIK